LAAEIRVFARSRSGGRDRKSGFSPDPGVGAGFPREPPETPKIGSGTEIWGSPGVTQDRARNRVFRGPEGVFRKNPDFWPGTRFLAAGTEIWVRNRKIDFFRLSAGSGVWGGFFAGSPGNPEKWPPGSPIRGSGRGSGRGTEKSEISGSGRVEK